MWIEANSSVRTYDFGIYSLFLFSIPIVNFILLTDKYSDDDFFSALLKALIVCASYSLLSKLIRIKHHPKPSGIIMKIFFCTTICITASVFISLSMVSWDSLLISRDFFRDTQYIRILNLHLIASILSILIFFDKNTKVNLALFLICISISLLISHLEGRRAALFIIGLFCLISWLSTSERFSLRNVFFASLFGVAIVFLIFKTTTSRLDIQINEFLTLIGLRIFNPGWMQIHIESYEYYSFNTQIFTQIVDRLSYIFYVSGNYLSVGNEFGRNYDIISSNNYIVGINPGLFADTFLSAPFFSYLILPCILLVGRFVVECFSGISTPFGILAALLLLHSFQMEAPYTIGQIVRLIIVYLIIRALTGLTSRIYATEHIR